MVFLWNDVIDLKHFATFNELCITLGSPIPGEDAQGGPLECQSHMKALRGLKLSALVFVYMIA